MIVLYPLATNYIVVYKSYST